MCATLTCPGWFTAAADVAILLRVPRAIDDVVEDDVATRRGRTDAARRHAIDDDDAIADDTARRRSISLRRRRARGVVGRGSIAKRMIR
jgi:hypothetical protein